MLSINQHREYDREKWTHIVDYVKHFIRNTNYDLEQNIIGSVKELSLNSFTIAKIATTLWQQEDIWNNISNKIFPKVQIGFQEPTAVFKDFLGSNWDAVLNQVLHKVSQLKVPQSIKVEIKRKVILVANEILKFFASLFCFAFTTFDKTKLCLLKQIIWNQQGTINHLKTAKCLVENTNLSLTERYIIACNNCLKEKILELHELLPDNFLNDITEQMDDRFLLTLYWTYHIRGMSDIAKFNYSLKREREIRIYDAQTNHYEENKIQIACSWAVYSESEVAIQHFYRNFTNEDVRGLYNNAHCIMFISNNANIIFYLMKLMDEATLNSFCIQYIFSLLKLFLKDEKWLLEIFPIVKEISTLIGTLPFFDALNFILIFKEEWFENGQYQETVVTFMNAFQSDIKNRLNTLCFTYIRKILYKNTDFINLLFIQVNNEVKLKYMYQQGLDLCKILFMENSITCFDKLIRAFLLTEKDRKEFKDYFLDTCFNDACQKLLKDSRYAVIDDWLKIFIAEKKDRTEFKYKMTYRYGKNFLSQYFNNRNLFLSWCFEGDTTNIDLFKRKFWPVNADILQSILDTDLPDDSILDMDLPHDS